MGTGFAISLFPSTMRTRRIAKPRNEVQGACASLSRCTAIRAKCAWRRLPPMATRCTRSSKGAISRTGSCRALFRSTRRTPWPGRRGCDTSMTMVGNVGWNQMNAWVHFYEDAMGFKLYQTFDDKDISTEYSALMSKVMSNGNGRIKFPINEPAEGRKKSQIEEYLDFYGGPGVQHIAMGTGNIIDTVTRLHDQGVDFLDR